MDYPVYLILIAALILLSAYFSATETAFSSFNKTRMKLFAERGDRRAQLVLKLSERYDRVLSTILIGNNIVNIALASIATVFFVHIMGDNGATVSSAVITVLVLIFGEISPKTLAKERPERFCLSTVRILNALILVLTPLSFLFGLWRKLLDKIFRNREDRRMTQDELLLLVEEVEQEGSIDADEGSLLRSAIEFTDRDAEDILTHRTDLEAISLDATKEEIAAVFSESRYSRLLVYDDTIDNVVGVLHQKDFYTGTGISDRPITELMAKPQFAPQSMKLSDMLKLLQKNKSHVAVITDEYGGTLGIVTMEDILEELVGEIWDEHDEVVELFRAVDERTERILCTAELVDFMERYDLTVRSESTSVGGWITEQFGRIPDVGESFLYKGLKITVTETDARRVVEAEAVRLSDDKE